ncbi:MAG: N-acetylmuramoyl-L-alanine amidase [Xanthobacteraceae bacterium]|nr:N-acetylmuramoyl-L-alanine amidase [Xanthobacteraceae bacterium]
MRTRLILGLALALFLALFWFFTGYRPAAAEDLTHQELTNLEPAVAETPVEGASAGQRVREQPPSSFEIAARSRGTPDFPGLNIIWITPWGDREDANIWHNVVVHQSEGPAGSAYANALAQAARPGKRGASIWVETDGTVYWATGEWATPSHVRSGNRNDNHYIGNADTYQLVPNNDSIGVEFVGNYPNVRKPPTEAQIEAWRILVKILQTRYGIPTDRIFAHNWVDYKDRRYCEGCMLASIVRKATTEVALQEPASKPDQ